MLSPMLASGRGGHSTVVGRKLEDFLGFCIFLVHTGQRVLADPEWNDVWLHSCASTGDAAKVWALEIFLCLCGFGGVTSAGWW